MSAMRRSHARRQSGQAMVAVLLIVLILTALAVTVTSSAKREARNNAAALRDAQAYFALRGAINYAAVELQVATNNGATMPDIQTPPDTDSNGWTQIGDAWYRLEIVDTASRVNLNLASVTVLARLPALSGDYATALAIVDWRDADDSESTSSGYTGAESSYYQSLDPAYDAKNAPFSTVDELLLVRGMTAERLYTPGLTYTSEDDSSTTSRNRAARQSLGSLDTTATTLALSEELTTYARELNVASDGTARVDITSASASTLRSTLGLTAAQASRLVAYRRNNAITSITDLLRVPGFNVSVMQQIGDKITVGSAQYRTGVYNINTAPAEVLATVPGIDEATCDAVIEARQSGTVFSGMNDIFAMDSIGRRQLTTLANSVCTKSSVYLVRVRVRIPGSRQTYAAEALIELTPADTSSSDSTVGTGSTTTSTTTPQATILQWRQVPRSFGWETWSSTATQQSTTSLTTN